MAQRRSLVLGGLSIMGVVCVAGLLLRAPQSYKPKTSGIFGEEIATVQTSNSEHSAGVPTPLTPAPELPTVPVKPQTQQPNKSKPPGKPHPLYAFA
jgi:hypothetical protein